MKKSELFHCFFFEITFETVSGNLYAITLCHFTDANGTIFIFSSLRSGSSFFNRNHSYMEFTS